VPAVAQLGQGLQLTLQRDLQVLAAPVPADVGAGVDDLLQVVQVGALAAVTDHHLAQVDAVLGRGRGLGRRRLHGEHDAAIDAAQLVRFDGNDLSDPIVAQHKIAGPLQQLLVRLDDLIEANIRTELDVTGRTTHAARPDYPVDALRQVTRNAIMHRAYDGTHAPVKVSWFADRIEVQSPGGPFGQVTIERFGQPGLTDYRNPHVAEALRVLGFVERFGVGLSIANKRLASNGNPPLEYDPQSNYVMVRLRRRPS